MSNTQNKKLNIISKPSALATDGNSLTMHKEGFADLLFFQVSNKTETSLNVEGIANLRMNVNQLKSLRDMLSMAINDYEKKNKELN